MNEDGGIESAGDAAGDCYPSPEFLLDDVDRQVITTYLDAGNSAPHDLRTQALDVELHLLKLLGVETLATARAKGLRRAFQGLYFTEAQTWPLLARPRRIVLAISSFSCGAGVNGLGQTCVDREELLPFWIEAVKLLAPPALVVELYPFLEQMRRCLWEMRERGEVARESCELWKGDALALETRVWRTDWSSLGLAHVLQNPDWFFLQPHQGSRRLPLPDYGGMEVAWRQAEQDRVRRDHLESEAEANARITDLRCSNCGKPMPGYRRTCKVCGSVRNTRP